VPGTSPASTLRIARSARSALVYLCVLAALFTIVEFVRVRRRGEYFSIEALKRAFFVGWHPLLNELLPESCPLTRGRPQARGRRRHQSGPPAPQADARTCRLPLGFLIRDDCPGDRSPAQRRSCTRTSPKPADLECSPTPGLRAPATCKIAQGATVPDCRHFLGGGYTHLAMVAESQPSTQPKNT